MTDMLLADTDTTSARYARCIEASRRVGWEIDRDVIRGRRFDFGHHFLPDGLSLVDRLDFLAPAERRLLSQIQGRTYAAMFGLVERFIGAKMLQITRRHWLGDQVALQALVRFSEEELKHQELFRRIEALIGEDMPAGYEFTAQPNAVAEAVLAASTWAVLALTCHIELFTQVHYRLGIAPDPLLSPLFKDVFLHHWREESQHAVIDELEWAHEDAQLDAAARDRAVDEFIALLGAVDDLLQAQARADSRFFLRLIERRLGEAQASAVQRVVLQAYRWQYIVSGARDDRFGTALRSKVSAAQAQRFADALAPLQA
ncbi:MAG: hypothetical protein QM722_04815 [Piscinibacter sp.]